MDEYISKEYIKNKCKEHRELYISAWGDFSAMPKEDKVACDAYATCWSDVVNAPPTDVQPAPQWISVKDRLPDENQKCLVYRDIDADLKITTGIWYSERKAFDGLRHGTRLEDTIAWMPLPEPPKDGDIG